jgi:hypothetical protein
MNKVLTPVRRLRPTAPNARLGPIIPEKSSDPAPRAVAATPPHQANAAGETRRVGIDDPRIKPRPTYHYRLPNARFDRGGAQLIREWNRWIAVERLAADNDALETLGRAFVEETIAGFDAADWAARTASRLTP